MSTERASGLLLHPTSLPSPFGIGDLGPAALSFVDQLAGARQRIWQVLPVGPTGYGDSPYQSLSAFAGNPLLISLEELVGEDLLARSDVGDADQFRSGPVDYQAVIAHRRALWPRLLERFEVAARPNTRARLDRFCHANSAWLDDFALFIAVKDAHDQRAWTSWPADIAGHEPGAVLAWSAQLAREIQQCKLTQFVFFEQWQSLRAHCRARGIQILGDLPIFVAHDSADVWARREFFRLSADGRPAIVTGVPPDYFSATGQLWGNPHYNWEKLAESGYAWWIDRVRATLALVDRVRLDHFRGFVAAWEVPGTATTALDGQWRPGPGARLFEAIQRALGASVLPFVAENLGVITQEVEALRRQFGLPGMAILQFAFGDDPQAPDFIPHNHHRDLVVYTGTHDNDTTIGWWTGDVGHTTRSSEAVRSERAYATRYLSLRPDSEINWELIRAAMASVAETAIVPVQDVLGLGSEARMNTPGTSSGNWTWRLSPGGLTADMVARLATLADTYDRD
jgi:4-alpha-glucanotransferase